MHDTIIGLLVGLAIGLVPAVVGAVRGRKVFSIVCLCLCGLLGATHNLIGSGVVSVVMAVFLMVKKPSDVLFSILLALSITLADGTRSAQKTIKANDDDYRAHPKQSIITDYFKAAAFGSAIGYFVYLMSKERQAKRKDGN